MSMTLTERRPAGQWLVLGVLGGIYGGVLMALFAMTAAATYQHTGFFTPMYHIASATGWGPAADAMKASMDAAATGDTYLFTTGPALAGIGIHLGVAMGWGLIFAALIRRVRAAGALPVIGTIYGLLVMLFMAFVELPIIARAFDGGEPIEKMAETVGWGTFSAEHAIYGLVLGGTLALGSVAMHRRAPKAELERERAHRPAA